VCVLACVCAEPLAKKKHLGRRGEDGEKKMAGKRKRGFRPPSAEYSILREFRALWQKCSALLRKYSALLEKSGTGLECIRSP